MRRIQITDTKHPWYKKVGFLTESIIQGTGQFIVELDNGFDTAVYLKQVRELL